MTNDRELITQLLQRVEALEAEVAQLKLGGDLLGPKNERSKPKRRMPADMKMSDEYLKVGIDAGFSEDRARQIFGEFRTYWHDQGTARASWLGTWRNKIKAELKRNPPASGADDMFGHLTGRYS